MVHAVRMMPSHSSGLFVLAEGVCDDKIVVICELKEPQTSVVGCNVAVGPCCLGQSVAVSFPTLALKSPRMILMSFFCALSKFSWISW